MLAVRKIGMYWIQVANPGVQIMDLQRTSLYLPVSISYTRWTLKFFQHGNVWVGFIIVYFVYYLALYLAQAV